MTSTYTPISCDLHDYLEIACLYRYKVNLELTSGARLSGTAITTETHPDKSEWLVVAVSQQQERIRQDNIRAISPLNTKAMFGRVLINEDN